MPEQNSSEKMWTPGRIIATFVVVVLIATIGIRLITGGVEEKTNVNVALPGTPATDEKVVPDDFEIKTIDGRAIRLSEFRGKVVVLDFWATWCPPCREEIPQLVRISRESQSRGVEVIGLHIDDRGRSQPADIQKMIDQFGINYTVGLATDDIFVSYLGRVETTIPQTLVFNRKGHAVAHFVGYDPSHATELDAAINRALAGS
ncbi:MAG: TlpA disulfide reductase family protein [Acidobacteriota bacterium]